MNKGFTLVELLVVIAIICILGAILYPVFHLAGVKERANAAVNGDSSRLSVADCNEILQSSNLSGRFGRVAELRLAELSTQKVEAAQTGVAPVGTSPAGNPLAGPPLGSTAKLIVSYTDNSYEEITVPIPAGKRIANVQLGEQP